MFELNNDAQTLFASEIEADNYGGYSYVSEYDSVIVISFENQENNSSSAVVIQKDFLEKYDGSEKYVPELYKPALPESSIGNLSPEQVYSLLSCSFLDYSEDGFTASPYLKNNPDYEPDLLFKVDLRQTEEGFKIIPYEIVMNKNSGREKITSGFEKKAHDIMIKLTDRDEQTSTRNM